MVKCTRPKSDVLMQLHDGRQPCFAIQTGNNAHANSSV